MPVKGLGDAEVDIVIIGAGIIGLAIAREFSLDFPGLDIVLVEKHHRYGQEVSSRNSEVIHAGIYYPSHSLKARLCWEGNRRIYDFCRQFGIAHNRCGKLIMAVDREEVPALQLLYRQGRENGVTLDWLGRRRIEDKAPRVRAVEALWSPDTGIVDSAGLMYVLHHQARQARVSMLWGSAVEAIEAVAGGYLVRLPGEQIKTRVLVNAAGLYSDRVAGMAGMDIDQWHYRLHYCRGEYYRLKPQVKFKHLLYPLPEKSGLGIHLTLDLNGGQRLGPDFQYVDDIDYSIDDKARDKFYRQAQRYLPWLEPEDISPDYAGIRPKLQTEGGEFRDFVISEESPKGYPGFINLIGIESPGLTSSLALARHVAEMVKELV